MQTESLNFGHNLYICHKFTNPKTVQYYVLVDSILVAGRKENNVLDSGAT